MELRKKFKDYEYNKLRVEAYSDAVIAIVITLLVLEIKAPHLHSNNIKECFIELHELMPELVSWLISFLLVGVYWLQHHNVLHMAHKIDLKIVVLNLISLMGICLTPFTASLIGKNYMNPFSVSLFSFIFFLISLTLCWIYAYIANHYLKDTYDKKKVLKNVRMSLIIGPAFYLIATFAAWISIFLAAIVLFFIPIIFIFPLDIESKK